MATPRKRQDAQPEVPEEDFSVSNWATEPEQASPEPVPERVPLPGDEEEPIEEVLKRCQQAYEERTRRVTAAYGIRKIRMPPGPYAIAHFGDDHLDDDGCDIAAYRAALRVVSATTGFYGGAVGDILNNWPDSSRLAQLYGHQRATIDDGWRLAEWSMRAIPWIYRVLGNHDLWNRGRTIIGLLSRGAKIGHMAPDEIRIELLSPGTEPVRLWARHDFKGNSIWNPAHGPMRASKLDGWGDIYIAGHRHEWVTHCEEGPDGRVRWALRARGFKRHDSYARSAGFAEQQYGDTVCTVVDPTLAHPYERVRVHLDVNEAAQHLTWLRKRAGF